MVSKESKEVRKDGEKKILRARKKMKKREGERESVKDESDRRNLKMRCHQIKLLIRKIKISKGSRSFTCF